MLRAQQLHDAARAPVRPRVQQARVPAAAAAAPNTVSSGCAVGIPSGLLLQLLLAHVGDLGGEDAGHREVLRMPG